MDARIELDLPRSLLLIALDDEQGSDTTWSGLDAGLAGALLLELSLAGQLVQEGKHLVPAGAADAPPGLLGEALAVVRREGRPRTPRHWVNKLPRDLHPLKARVAGGLVAAGVVVEERRKILGLFPDTRYPTTDPSVEATLREHLRAVLLHGATPDPRTGLLAALLEPLDLVKRVVERPDRRVAKQRAQQIRKSVPVSEAVARTVDDATAAILAATTASAASGGDGGGGGGD